MGPLADSRPWATKDVVGAQRFLQRVWRLVVDERPAKPAWSMTRQLDTNTLRRYIEPSRGSRRLCRTAQ